MRFGPCLCIALKGFSVESAPGSAISNSGFLRAYLFAWLALVPHVFFRLGHAGQLRLRRISNRRY